MRICLDCDKDISHRGHRSVRCETHQHLRNLHLRRLRHIDEEDEDRPNLFYTRLLSLSIQGKYKRLTEDRINDIVKEAEKAFLRREIHDMSAVRSVANDIIINIRKVNGWKPDDIF